MADNFGLKIGVITQWKRLKIVLECALHQFVLLLPISNTIY